MVGIYMGTCARWLTIKVASRVDKGVAFVTALRINSQFPQLYDFDTLLCILRLFVLYVVRTVSRKVSLAVVLRVLQRLSILDCQLYHTTLRRVNLFGMISALLIA